MSTETLQIQRPDNIQSHRDLDVVKARANGASPFVIVAHDHGATIDIFCEIGGWGVYACEIIYRLQELDGPGRRVDIRLHSDGGDVFEAFAIATAIMLMEAEVVVTIYGVAASAATFLVAAADKVIAARHSMLMIHEPSCLIFGNASKLAEGVSLLERLRETVARMYSAATNGVISYETALNEWMAPGVSSWFTAEAAQSFGLVDEIIDDVVVTNCLTPRNLTGDLPEGVEALLAGPAIAEPVAEVEACADATEPETPAASDEQEAAPAEITADAEITPEAAPAEPETPAEPEGLTIEAQAEIRTACKLFDATDRADEFISARATLDQVRAALWDARAEASARTEINPRVAPVAEDPKPAVSNGWTPGTPTTLQRANAARAGRIL